jgi:hypothetical protein
VGEERVKRFDLKSTGENAVSSAFIKSASAERVESTEGEERTLEKPPSLTTPPSQSSLDSFSLTPLTTFPSSFFPPLFPAILWENQTSQTYFNGCSSDDSLDECFPLAREREGPLVFFFAPPAAPPAFSPGAGTLG